ncbi:MAG: hypothetical protein ABJA67_15895 [Chthonomonadales bacterium]
MSDNQRSFRIVGVLLFLFLVQIAIGPILHIRGHYANLSLTGLLVASLYGGAVQGCRLGLLMGILEASFAVRYVGSIIVTRVIAGFVIGSMEERIFRDNIAIACLTAAGGTLAAETLFFVVAPQPAVIRWFTGIVVESVLNGLLGLLVFPLFHLALRKSKAYS